jgi:hypothetical protein
MFLRKFLNNLGVPQTAPNPAFADNEICIATASPGARKPNLVDQVFCGMPHNKSSGSELRRRRRSCRAPGHNEGGPVVQEAWPALPRRPGAARHSHQDAKDLYLNLSALMFCWRGNFWSAVGSCTAGQDGPLGTRLDGLFRARDRAGMLAVLRVRGRGHDFDG